jgi:hypothetical protein
VYGNIINTDIFHDMGVMGKYRQIEHGNMVGRVVKRKMGYRSHDESGNKLQELFPLIFADEHDEEIEVFSGEGKKQTLAG